VKHSIVAFVGIHAVFAVKQRLRRPPTSLLALHATDITAPLVTHGTALSISLLVYLRYHGVQQQTR